METFIQFSHSKLAHTLIFDILPGLIGGAVLGYIVVTLSKITYDLWKTVKRYSVVSLSKKPHNFLARHIGRRFCEHDHRKVLELYPISKGETFHHPFLQRDMVKLTRPAKQCCVFCGKILIADMHGMCEAGDDWKSQIQNPEGENEA